MANIKEYIKKVMDGTVSLEEQQAALAQVEKTIVEAKQRRDESVGQKADMVVQALKTIEAKLEAKLVELNNTPAMQGVQGPAGKAGKDGVDGKDGLNGVSGKDGKDGINGVDGKDGVSVVDAKIDFDGSLVVYLSNGAEIDCGQILSPDVAQNIIISSGGSGTSQVVTDTLASLQAAITTLTTQIAPNTGIAGWNYSDKFKSITTEETAPTGLFLSPDGLNMYVCGSTGDDVNQYTLSTAFDVSTASFVRLFSVAAQDTTPSDIFFKPDGLTMFILGDTNNGVFQYTLTSAFDISTATYASKAFSVTSQETTPVGLWFKSDGTVMYVIGTANDTVFQYTLGTAWDVSTASYANISFNVQTQEGTPNQVNLSADGLKMWILGATGDDITQYALGTAFNVSTAVFENSFYVGFQDNNPQGLFIDSTAANRVYFVGTTNDTVFQYNTATNSISAVTDVFNTTSNARVQGNLAVQSNAYVDGALNVQGTTTFSGSASISGALTATSTITLQGTTTSTIALGTSVTSGTISVGGTSGTGIITLGQSTVSQTTNIQAGATASGSTKTIALGTAGLSGSTTNIAIGSAVSGSLGTTTIQAPTVNIGQTATQFQVTNTASAVNYVQTTGSLTGFGAKLLAAGANTDIPLILQPKGTGALQAQQTDSTTAGGNARGANAVDWSTERGSAGQVASGAYATISGGRRGTASAGGATVGGGWTNTASGTESVISGGSTNTASGQWSFIGGGAGNTAAGFYNVIGGGFTNAGTSNSAVTTQATTTVTSGSTAVTLSGSNANIRVGQLVTGTGIAFPSYVSAISGTSLTLNQNATATGTPTLSFFTPYGVVVGGGNNQATGSYSFIGGGGDAGTAANRNVASGDWSFVGGGQRNTASAIYATVAGGANSVASGQGAFVGGGGWFGSGVSTNTASGTSSFIGAGYGNTASGFCASVVGGSGNTANQNFNSVLGGANGIGRSISGYTALPSSSNPLNSVQGSSQTGLLVLARQTTDATATALASDTSAASTTNQVILPNNSAYFFTGEVVSGVTGGGNTKGWTIEGVIKRGANAAATTLVGTPTVTSTYGDAGASAWTIAVTADTTNGGLRVTFTGQASTTIRTVCQIRTTEMTY